MKHFYTALLFAAMSAMSAMSASATTQSLPVTRAGTLKHTPAALTRAESSLDSKAMRPLPDAPVLKNTPADDETVEITVPSGEWIPLGTGTWCEGLFTEYGADDDLRWPVEIEQSAEQPGWYRCIPYGSNSPISELVGTPDNTTYVYINATDPNRVYIPEYEVYNGQYPFCQLVPENGWGNAWMEYGYMEDGMICFDADTFVTWYVDRWNLCGDGNMCIGLPGTHIPDYRLATEAPFCAYGNEIGLDLTVKGDDIATLKAMVLEGLVDLYSENSYIVAELGTEIDADADRIIVSDLDKRGLYSYYLVALDADGNIVNARLTTVMAEFDNDDEWETVGTGTMYEGIVSPFYMELPMTIIDVDVEKHKTQPGYFRLKDPMKYHPVLSTIMTQGHDHHHYIYINAADPDGGVYIEASSLGLETPNGQAAVWSQFADYLEAGMTPDYLKGYALGGSMTDDGLITFPNNTLLYAERGYKYGQFVNSGDRMRIDLYHATAIREIGTDNTDTAPCRYYNLQGVAIDNPAQGQTVIRLGNAKAEKIIYRN